MTRARGIRWWPLVLIVFLAAGVLGWVWLLSDGIGQFKTIATLSTLATAVILSALWFLLLSRLGWKVRVLGLAVMLAGVLALPRWVEIRGVTGNLLPLVSWKSARTAAGPEVESRATPLAALPQADFPQFLGPDRNGKLAEMGLASGWQSPPPREIWRRAVGDGWSAFAVRGELAITQEQRGGEELVVAYDLATGDVRWTHADEARYETTIGGIGPRATPTIDGGRVYTMGATGILNALDLATGAELWSHDLIAEYGATLPDWGKSCSPLAIDEGIVVSAGGDRGRSLVAFDRETGAEIWSGGDDASGYSSPLVTTLAGVRQIVVFNKASVAGHDPGDGSVLWSFPWSREQPNVAQPLVLAGDRLLVSSGYGVGAKLLRISRGADGGLGASVLWETPRLKAKFAHYVDFEGYVYGLDDGVLVCLDPATGERCWKRGRYGHGQLLLAGGLIVLQAENGDVVLIEPNPEELTELGRFAAFDRKTWNIPALAGTYLLVRNDREAAMYELPRETG